MQFLLYSVFHLKTKENKTKASKPGPQIIPALRFSPFFFQWFKSPHSRNTVALCWSDAVIAADYGLKRPRKRRHFPNCRVNLTSCLCSLLPLPDVTWFLVLHYLFMTKISNSPATTWSSLRTADSRWSWKFLDTGCPGSGPGGFSITGYIAFNECLGFEDSFPGIYFLKKATHSGISCCLGIDPRPDTMQTARQGAVGEGEGPCSIPRKW